MKTITLLIAMTLSLSVFAQKIKKNEVDKFNGLRRIETDYVTLSMTFTTAVDMKIRSADTSIFLFVRGADGVIADKGELTFLLTDDSKVVAVSTGIQSGTLDGGFQYRITSEAASILSRVQITDVRISKSGTYDDRKVQSTYRPYLVKLFKVFLAEYFKTLNGIKA